MISEGERFRFYDILFVTFVMYRTPIRGVIVDVGSVGSVIGDGVRCFGSVPSVQSAPSVLIEVGWGVRLGGGRGFRWGGGGRWVEGLDGGQGSGRQSGEGVVP